MKNSYMNNEKCSGVEILYNLFFSFSISNFSFSTIIF